MQMSYSGALVLPTNYSIMSDEEMTYLEGGIGYRRSYAKVSGAMAKAVVLKALGGYDQLSHYDLAAEIYSHAYAYYNLEGFLSICEGAGFSTTAIRNSSFCSSLYDGITLENGLDTNTIGGVKRYIIYRAVYAAALLSM